MKASQVSVQREQPDDEGGVRLVNEVAFGRSNEADLVERLRKEGEVLAPFVAKQGEGIVGHVLFSRILIDAANEPVLSVALAPFAVLPVNQRRGAGSQLLRFGLEWL